MKEIQELKFPEDVRYTKDHEWLRKDGDVAVAGISDFAQDRLGDVVFVELPKAGDSFDKGEAFGSIESVKAVSELYMPVGGEIIEVNPLLEDSPELVNRDPYGEGWMIRIRPSDPGQTEGLMDRKAYLETLKG
jgi:glycine cleavage system H protein